MGGGRGDQKDAGTVRMEVQYGIATAFRYFIRSTGRAGAVRSITDRTVVPYYGPCCRTVASCTERSKDLGEGPVRYVIRVPAFNLAIRSR